VHTAERRMRKPISPRIHGIIDYTTSATIAALPGFIEMPKRARRLFRGLGAGYTGLSSVTDYPLAAKRLVPFKAHGAAELAVGAALPAMPWVLGFQRNRAARTLCFGITALTAVVASLTDWDGDRKRRRR
jgi:hypothetical protein